MPLLVLHVAKPFKGVNILKFCLSDMSDVRCVR